MRKFVVTGTAFLFFTRVIVNAETLVQFLFERDRYPSSVSKSIQMARMEKERIPELATQMPGAAVFLPVDSAWDAKPGAYEALMNEATGNVRYDLLLASSAAIPADKVKDVSSLYSYTQSQQGIVDSAFGTSYTMPKQDSVCDFYWTGDQYTVGNCAKLLSNGISLDDAVIFFIDSLLVPDDIDGDIDHLLETERRRRRV